MDRVSWLRTQGRDARRAGRDGGRVCRHRCRPTTFGEALVATSNDDLRARLHTDMAKAVADAFELQAAREHAALGVEAAQRTGREHLQVRSLATAAYIATIMGSADADDLLGRALFLETAEQAASYARSAHYVAALRAMYEDRIDEARTGLQRLALLAARAAAPTPSRSSSPTSALSNGEPGASRSSMRLADEAHQIALQTGYVSTIPLALHLRAQALAHLGRAAEARATAASVHLAAEETGQQYWLGLVDEGMLGFLALSLGNSHEAMDVLDGAADRLFALEAGEPSLFTFLPDAIEAAIDEGRLERSRDSSTGSNLPRGCSDAGGRSKPPIPGCCSPPVGTPTEPSAPSPGRSPSMTRCPHGAHSSWAGRCSRWAVSNASATARPRPARRSAGESLCLMRPVHACGSRRRPRPSSRGSVADRPPPAGSARSRRGSWTTWSPARRTRRSEGPSGSARRPWPGTCRARMPSSV